MMLSLQIGFGILLGAASIALFVGLTAITAYLVIHIIERRERP